MNVKNITEMALGFPKSYVIVETLEGKINTIKVKRDKKRFNKVDAMSAEYYFLNNGNRVYVNEIKAAK